ncbi:hypothetical protein ACMT1E_00130 [Sphingomonas flavalba]|uniref:hypothetical protein n=1 Tax=Sphingomonas flavalba TaxID=2559804 RepID=UPI0039E05630
MAGRPAARRGWTFLVQANSTTLVGIGGGIACDAYAPITGFELVGGALRDRRRPPALA